MSDLSPVDRLIALAGSERVSGYTRRTKTGKVVRVSSYTRDPGKMPNNALFKELTALNKGQSDLPPQAASNRKKQLVDEIKKRQKEGRWGQSEKREGERARKRVATPEPGTPAAKRVQKRGTGHSTTDEFQKNKLSPKKPFEGGVDDPEDPEYTAHVERLREILQDPKNDKYDTQKMFGVENPDKPGEMIPGLYTPERAEQHKQIIAEILERHANVPKDRVAIMSGGLGGSGKGTVLGKYADVDHSQYITVDPDELKGELLKRGMVPEVPGLLPLEHANYIHEESSDLANMLHDVAMRQGFNIILDTTMASPKAKAKVEMFKDNGYEVEAIFVDVPVEVSVKSALSRHRNGVNRFRTGAVDEKTGFDDDMGGRYVPPEIIEKAAPPEGSPYKSKNRGVFEDLRAAGLFTRSRIYDNSIRTKTSKPVLVLDDGVPPKPQKGAATKKALGKVLDQASGQGKKPKEKVALSAVERLVKLTIVN